MNKQGLASGDPMRQQLEELGARLQQIPDEPDDDDAADMDN